MHFGHFEDVEQYLVFLQPATNPSSALLKDVLLFKFRDPRLFLATPTANTLIWQRRFRIDWKSREFKGVNNSESGTMDTAQQ